jgi:hypothetical protein
VIYLAFDRLATRLGAGGGVSKEEDGEEGAAP